MSVAKHCEGCGKAITPRYPGNTRRLKWCSDKCRKRTTYSGVCAVCGGRTDGVASGYARASMVCRACAPDFYRKWTKERVVRVIREWARLYGEPPAAYEWNGSPSMRRHYPTADWKTIDAHRAAGIYPGTSEVQKVFGSWSGALKAAGFESKPGYYRRELNKRRTPKVRDDAS